MLSSNANVADLPALESAIEKARRSSENRFEAIERALFLIRNVGITAPMEAKAALHRQRAGLDGALAESWTSIALEVEEVVKAPW